MRMELLNAVYINSIYLADMFKSEILMFLAIRTLLMLV